MRKFFFLIFVGSASIICTSSATAQYAQWTGSDLSIGKGYDTFLRKARGRCVVFDRRGPRPVAGEDLKFELRTVENESSLFNKLGISVAAKYGVAKGSASYDKETAINRYSVYFFVSGSIEVGKESVTGSDLTAPKLELERFKQLDAKQVQGFREKCGDSYISGMSYGGKYIALVEIKTQRDSEVQSIQAAVSGSAGGFSGEVNAKARLEAATANREVSIKVLRSAGDGAAIPTSIEGLTKAITSFPDALRGLPTKKLQPFDVTVEDYVSIDAPEHIKRSDFSTIDKESFIEDADRFVVKHRSAIADASYAIANPDQFPGLDKETLQRYVDEADPKVLDVVRQINRCLQGIGDCNQFIPPSLNISLPPARTEGPSRFDLIASIDRSRAALDSIILPENDSLKRYCVKLLQSKGDSRIEGFGGCVWTMNSIREQCSSSGCRP